MQNNDLYNKAVKLKGYGSNNRLSPKEYSKLERIIPVCNGLSVKPKVITNLQEYVGFIEKLDYKKNYPLFYRGQGNCNYLMNPGSLRNNPKFERQVFDSFYRRFGSEIDSCKTNMEKLILMQHFGIGTRALDISENPLAALYFACSPMKKFNQNREAEFCEWGEVIIFQEPDVSQINTQPIYSSDVSLISSIAFVRDEFDLWRLGALWKNDHNLIHNECYIPLGDVIRKSIIARVPQNNQRIKNQQGAFILVNACEVTEVFGNKSCSKDLTEYLLEKTGVIYNDLLEKPSWNKYVKNNNTWELKFQKIVPYSGNNRIKIFDTDPFDIHKLYYREKDIQRVVLIPPDCKKSIVKQLERFNITEDFIYPDMDNVANEINENIRNEK